MNSKRLALIVCALATATAVASSDRPSADDKERKASSFDASKLPTATTKDVDFVRDIRPILDARCWRCHGEAKHESGLSLHRKEAAFAGGDNGKEFEAGKSAESRLVRFISGLDSDTVMPPDGEGERLSAEQVALFRAWIDQGAKWPAEADSLLSAASSHWAYKKPERPAVPQVKTASWPKNEIDSFVLARLEKEGLAPQAEADRARLIRRVSLDLIGLPPTVEEVDAFLADKSPDAYEKVVDRLLASPRYGERWARPWLDLARYADTHGYEKDPQRSMWPYRDWVINALNRNMPFDQFTIEQLAGDLLPNATLDQKIATGFHRNTMVNTEGGVDPEEYRVAAVIDRVNTTATVWLGTTLGCCQCHSHKYDPFKQKEYYQFMAFFNSTADIGPGDDPKASVPTAAAAADQAEIAKLEATLNESTPELAAAQAKWEQSNREAPTWTVLQPREMKSAIDATVAKESDGSIFVSGKNDQDTYTIKAESDLAGVTAVRLETLTDSRLPNKGPGRAPNGNFVISEFRAKVAAKSPPSDAKPVEFQRAEADYSQKQFPVANAIDGKPDTGWAVGDQMGHDHTAIFELKQPIGEPGGTRWIFKIEQKHADGQHSLGRFRISVTTTKPPIKLKSPPANIAAIVAIEPDKRNDAQKNELAAYYRSIAPELKPTRDALDAAHKKLAADTATTLVMQELPKPREQHLFVGGSFLNPGEPVTANVPAVLNPLAAGQPLNRLTLAKWLVDPANPLTARVAINRIWAQYFGNGIVLTAEDFGTKGERPTNPELLDWLATEFIRRGWDMKAMHRLIVTSATYRQSSRATPELVERDPMNRLLARGPRVRLEAEMVRDQALTASGLLSPKIGGPSVMPPQPDGVWSSPYSGEKWVTATGENRYRRGLYTFWKRTAPYASFMSFDAPSREFCVVRRPRTNTPLQALTLLNDPVYVEAAQALARRMVKETTSSDPQARLTRGFKLCLSRAPAAAEIDRLLALYNHELDHFRADAKAAAAMIGANPDRNADSAELAAWTVVANVLLNLDETSSKG